VAPRLEPFKAAIDAMLRSDLDAPKKQCHTARRVLARLVGEHGGVSQLQRSARLCEDLRAALADMIMHR
jgi:hypothetical protein